MESESDKLELEKSCGNMFRGVGITQSVQGMSKNDFRTCLENLNFYVFLEFFHPESQIHVRSSDLNCPKGFEIDTENTF